MLISLAVYLPAVAVDVLAPGLFPVRGFVLNRLELSDGLAHDHWETKLETPVQRVSQSAAQVVLVGVAGDDWRRRPSENRFALPAEFLCLHVLLPHVVRALRVRRAVRTSWR